MQNQYPPVIAKSLEVIKRFEEKFGWFSIRVYQFPQINGFSTFLESVQRTLLRHRAIGWYMWARIRGTDKLLLIYFGRGQWEGHFEQETDKIIPAQRNAKRLDDVCYKQLSATVYPGASGCYMLYEDDGKTTGYTAGKSAWIKTQHSKNGRVRTFDIKLEQGSYNGFENSRDFELRFAGVVPPQEVKINGVAVPWCYDFDELESESAWRYDGMMTDIVVKCGKIDLVSGCKVEVIYNVDDEFAPASGLRGAFSRLQEIANLNNTMISRWPKCEERLGQKLGSTARRISLAPETFYSEVADMRSELPALIEMLDVLVPTVIKDRNDELKSANIKRAKLLVDEIFV